MHAQGDEAGFQFWMRMLGGSLVRLAGTPEPLLPWLTDEIEWTEPAPNVLVMKASSPVRLVVSSAPDSGLD